MTEQELVSIVANNLLLIRKHLRLTQEQAAEKMDITKSMLSKYENGTSMPNFYTLYKISETYGVSIDMLLGKEDITINVDTNLLPVVDDEPAYTYPETTEYAAHLDEPNKPVSEERVREIIQEAFDLYQKKMNK